MMDEEKKTIYPRFYLLIDFIGCHAETFLLIIFLALLLSVLIYSYLIISDKINFMLLIFSLFTSLFILEFSLRSMGYYPGYNGKLLYFTPVNKLRELNGFVTDSNGIQKISEEAGITIMKRINENDFLSHFFNRSETWSVYSLSFDYLSIRVFKGISNLGRLYFFLKNKTKQELTELENEIVKYINCPINSEGFKSIAFKKMKSKKPSVLLLGDSFTWGMTIINNSNSFADELLCMGYVVYNTGITATDVAQYLAISKKYIVELKPNFVVVNFFIGNDINYYKREIIPYQPLFYSTNAGIIYSFQNGMLYNSAENAYDNIVSRVKLPTDSSLIKKLCFKTTLTTFFFKLINNTYLFPYIRKGKPNIAAKSDTLPPLYPHYLDELREIKEIAEKNNSIFILSSLPEIYKNSEKRAADFESLFGDLQYVEMEVDKTDYSLGDAHFNEKGHRRYAFFLDSIMTVTLASLKQQGNEIK